MNAEGDVVVKLVLMMMLWNLRSTPRKYYHNLKHYVSLPSISIDKSITRVSVRSEEER